MARTNPLEQVVWSALLYSFGHVQDASAHLLGLAVALRADGEVHGRSTVFRESREALANEAEQLRDSIEDLLRRARLSP